MDERDKRVRFMAKLPPDLHRRLKVAAAQRDMNMNDLLVWMLRYQLHRLETGQEEVQR
jgi:predicted HicB family RNase H-like nuclease